MNAWAVGSAGSIYHSSDGGKEWHRQLGEQQRSDIREVLFYNDKVGWIASSDGTLSETNDGGQTWERLNIRTRQPLIGIHFTSLEPKWGWTMRRDGTVHYTTNGTVWSAGETPEQPPFIEGDPPGTYSLNDVDFGKFSEGWAVGRYGDIIHNRDGGPTWSLQRTTTNDTLQSIDMKFSPLGWAVGQAGTIQRTVNGGEYWKMHESNTIYNLNSVDFVTKRIGWIVGEAGLVLKTEDGGFTWQPNMTGTAQTLNSIIAISEGELFAVGNSGTIVRSEDGGKTWQQEHTDIDNDLYVISKAKNGNTLWVVGQWGVILRRNLNTRLQASKR